MREKKRFLLPFIFTAAFLLAFLFTVTVAASSPNGTTPCGENAGFTYEDGTLKISGEGALDSYTLSTPAPWSAYAQSIVRVEIGEGITSIGSYSFYNYKNIESVSFPSTLKLIGERAFMGTGITTLDLPASVVSIGKEAFASCEDLAIVKSLGNITSLAVGVFENCRSLVTVYLPKDLQSIYLSSFHNEDKDLRPERTLYYAGTATTLSSIRVYKTEGVLAQTPIASMFAKNIYYAVQLTVCYNVVGGKESAPPDYTAIGYPDGTQTYEVPSPTVTGHTPNLLTVTGDYRANEGGKIIHTVVYTPEQYNFSLIFVDHKGRQLEGISTYSTTHAYGERVNFNVRDFLEANGQALYTAALEKELVEIEKLTGPYTEEITCYPPKYQLRIEFIDEKTGAPVADSYTELVYMSDSYSKTVPDFDFYTRKGETDTVEGVMGQEDVTVTVYYTPWVFTLVVQYLKQDGAPMTGFDGEPLPDVEMQLNYRGDYLILPPQFEHYTVDREKVQGVLEGLTDEQGESRRVVFTVVYSLNSYDVSVLLKDAAGNLLADPFVYPERVLYGDSFTFAVPKLDGYTAEKTELSGIMDTNGKSIVLLYTKNAEKPQPKVGLVVLFIALGFVSVGGAYYWAMKKLR